MHCVFKQFAPFLQAKRGSWEQFKDIWGPAIDLLTHPTSLPQQQFSWSEVKAQYDMLIGNNAEEETDTIAELTQQAATTSAVKIIRLQSMTSKTRLMILVRIMP